ncbi:hypothetical protein [Wolbachia endosymbiont (group A) of Agelastica alni]|uniref:hypothetical protein n=1 Tax=Wolbachia endosymbiont (group A) of Agelastica alni TaxID=3066130 RepID=UPI003132DA6F
MPFFSFGKFLKYLWLREPKRGQRVTLESQKKDDVIRVADTGMALLHSVQKN